jgi:plasmid stabilization system protein ParE
MAKLVWSPASLRDIASIVAFIAADSPVAAKRFREKLLARTRQLKTTPLMGGYVLEDESRTYRELLHGNYRVIYRCDIAGKTAYIVAVHHAARLLNPTDLG